MSWYSASAIFLFEYKEGEQDTYDILENVYLIEANSPEEACLKADVYAKRDEGDDDGSLMLNERPARLVYHGIRKLINVVNLNTLDDSPTDGAEVTFSKYRLKSKDELYKWINSEALTVFFYEE